MIKFAHPEYLMYLFVLPAVALLFWLIWFLKNRTLRRYGNRRSILRMVEGHSRIKYWIRSAVFILVAAALIVAYANPKVGSKFEEVTRSGIDLIVAIDVSSSMNAEDIKPNRMRAAKRELVNLINNLKGDRIGIIVFAGDSYMQLPLTMDYNAALMLTDVITTGIAPTAGTSIASAINLARESFSQDEDKYRAIVVITDGESHEDDAITAAQEANAEGIVIHTIGMGSIEGAPIPVYAGGKLRGHKKDNDGTMILSKLDATTLVEVSGAGGGSFTQAVSGRDNLSTVFDEIEKMEKKDFGTKQFTDFEDRFQFLLALAIFLLLTELMISEKRNRFLSRFSIFNPSDDSRS